MSACVRQRSTKSPGNTKPNALLPAERTDHDSLALERDSTLVHLAKQDIRAFAPLYERYRDDVLRYCVRCLVNWDDAADATQQTFTNALAGIAQFQDRQDSFRGWLFRIAHNEVVSRHRQRTRRPEHALADAGSIADEGASPEELAIVADAHRHARILFVRLPPAQRQCCELRFSGLSYRETASLLGTSEVAARASFSRGLAALRELMAEDD